MFRLIEQPWWESGIVVWLLRRYKVSNGWTQAGAGISAFLAGICYAHFKLWESHPLRTFVHWWIETLTFIALSLTATAISLARENVRLSDSEELIKTKALLTAKDQQLKSWINTSHLIRQIIKQKQVKLLSIKQRRLTLWRAMAEIWDKSEPALILRIIHDQFRTNFGGGANPNRIVHPC